MGKLAQNANVDNGKFLNMKDEGLEVMVDTDINIAQRQQEWKTIGS